MKKPRIGSKAICVCGKDIVLVDRKNATGIFRTPYWTHPNHPEYFGKDFVYCEFQGGNMQRACPK